MDFMGIAAALLLLILSAMLFGGGAQNATKHGHDNIKGEAQEATEPASNPDMSVTTTQKNSTFQSTPLQDVKKLTDVPGVGPKSAEKLKEANIDSAVKLMGNYLVMGMDEKKMVYWLHDVCELREQEAKKVTDGLAEKATKMVAN